MGLDQKLVRVKNTNLDNFYAAHLDSIIAPYNPNLDQAYINKTAQTYEKLEELWSQALIDNDVLQTEEYRDEMDKLISDSNQADIWYGRKENHIHQWVIDHYDGADISSTNTDYILINPDQLLADVATVIENPELADDVLPTQSGFFFGSTEYDEYYFDGLKELHQVLTAEKNEHNFDNCSYFYWSWW